MNAPEQSAERIGGISTQTLVLNAEHSCAGIPNATWKHASDKCTTITKSWRWKRPECHGKESTFGILV